MKERLIVTRSDDNIKEMCEITHPIIKKYAEKCDADFIILKNNNEYHPHYRIMQIGELLNERSQILCLDSDILILKQCPNIFDVVPQDCIASIYEDKFSRKEDRRKRIKRIQDERGDVGWRKGYINTGFILFSKIHRDLFDYKEEELYLDLGYDDVYLKYYIEKKGYKVYELPCEWNFMSMFMEEKSRADAFVLHYAGMGHNPNIERTEQIKQDKLLFEKYGLLL